jgi:glycoside/pentoside/hexuronide:cation symporter, GPH family
MALIVLIGMALSGVFMLPWGILADIVDFAEYRYRERREAATIATFLVLLKAGSAVSIGFIGWVLGRLGYMPGASQAPEVLSGMRWLAFGVPAAGCLISIFAATRLSIGHRDHARIVRILDARRTAARNGGLPSLL